MFLRIIINFITLFMIFGCGFMFDGKKKSSDDPKVSDEIKSFVLGLAKGSSVDSVLEKSMSFAKKSDNSKKNTYQKESLESCESGGSIHYIEKDSNRSDIYTLKIIADNCIDEGVKISYSAFVTIKEKDDNLSKITILLKQDAVFEDLETTIISTFFKDSIRIIDEISANEAIVTETINFSDSIGEKYRSINLISHDNYKDNSYYSSYDISGQIVYKGLKYSVDEVYDGSKTPMTFIYEDDNEYLASGTTKYYNEEHQHITIEVVKKDTLKISVDIDSDGEDDAMETVKI